MVFFDVPTCTSEQRTSYRHFRDFLLNDGYIHIQHSVYARHCHNSENADTHQRRLKKCLPPKGQIRALTLSDQQFDRMPVFDGTNMQPKKRPVEQLMLL